MKNNINIENIKKNIEQLKQDLTSFKKEYLSEDSVLVTDSCLKNWLNEYCHNGFEEHMFPSKIAGLEKQTDNPHKYLGEVKKHQAYGYGIYIYDYSNDPDGVNYQYFGQWENNKRTGLGLLLSSDGYLYYGNLVEGKENGLGIVFYPDGSLYQGQWEDGLYHGWGRSVFSDGASYEGFYQKNNIHGNGKFTFTDGSIYSGDWENNTKHGIGEYHYPDGSSYSGDWENDQITGNGEKKYSDGSIYSGGWNNNLRTGEGEFCWVDGSKYSGEWYKDSALLTCIYTHKTGTTYKSLVDVYIDFGWRCAEKILKLSGDVKLMKKEEYQVLRGYSNEIYVFDHLTKIKQLVLKNKNCSPNILKKITDEKGNYKNDILCRLVAAHPNITIDIINDLLKHKSKTVRQTAAMSIVINNKKITELILKADRYILKGLMNNPNCDERNISEIKKLLEDLTKYPVKYQKYILGFNCRVYVSESVGGSIDIESIAEAIVSGDDATWFWDNEWYNYDDLWHTYGLNDTVSHVQIDDKKIEPIFIKTGSYDPNKEGWSLARALEEGHLVEGEYYLEASSHEVARDGWNNWYKYFGELEYEFDPENLTPIYEDGICISYSYKSSFEEVEFISDEMYLTDGKGHDCSVFYVKNGQLIELSGLSFEEIRDDIRKNGINPEEKEAVLKYLKEKS